MESDQERAGAALEQLRVALARRPEVVSAVLYGSYVRGTYRSAASDIDLALVVRGGELDELAPALREAWRAARIEPWIVRDDELAGLCDVFATRVRDLQRAHRLLHGDDPWPALVVPRPALRLRVEQELRNRQIRLRRARVLGDPSAVARAVHGNLAGMRLLLELVEELAGVPDPGELVAAAARRYDVPREDVAAVLDRHGSAAAPAGGVLAALERLLDRAIALVDRLEDQ